MLKQVQHDIVLMIVLHRTKVLPKTFNREIASRLSAFRNDTSGLPQIIKVLRVIIYSIEN